MTDKTWLTIGVGRSNYAYNTKTKKVFRVINDGWLDQKCYKKTSTKTQGKVIKKLAEYLLKTSGYELKLI